MFSKAGIDHLLLNAIFVKGAEADGLYGSKWCELYVVKDAEADRLYGSK